MSLPDLESAAQDRDALARINRWLEQQSAEARVDWSTWTLPGNQAVASSFGAQSAVSLHLLTQRVPNIPVLLMDTGHLFPETYRFIDELSAQLNLNLRVYRAAHSSAWQTARHGKEWEAGVEGLNRYNQRNKVEPMQRALRELEIRTWYAGLRRSQSESRRHIPILEQRDGRWKFHPLADWSDRDVWHYLTRHDLPYHPLWHDGYLSIGDQHSTIPWREGLREEDTRFQGLKRECGLHGLEEAP